MKSTIKLISKCSLTFSAFILWCVVNTNLVEGNCNKPTIGQCLFVNLTKMPDLSIIWPITPPIFTVYIYGNKFSTLPADAFINATRGWFSNVNIINNEIRYIHPKAFRGLKVSVLLLRENLFSNIEEGTFSYMWQRFWELDLRHNKLSAINRGMFKGLVFRRKVSRLKLQGNNIHTIECKSFLHIGNLSTLTLSYNRLVSLEKGMFLGLSFLGKLHLENNQIRYVENGTFEILKKLTELYLQNNFIEYITIHGLSTLECLDLSNNNLHILQQGMFDNLLVLEDLNLSKNKISNIEVTFLKNIKRVGKLSLQGNKLTNINKHSFKEMPEIKTLDISNNKIDKIENEAFTHVMSRYFVLNVDGNVLQYLSWKSFAGEFSPYLKRKFKIHYSGKLKCVRELCWMKQGYQKFIKVEGDFRNWRQRDRKEEQLNKCYLSLHCPTGNLLFLNCMVQIETILKWYVCLWISVKSVVESSKGENSECYIGTSIWRVRNDIFPCMIFIIFISTDIKVVMLSIRMVHLHFHMQSLPHNK